MNPIPVGSPPADLQSTAGSVLVADDDDQFLETTCAILRKAGHRVEGVADARSVPARLQVGLHDVLVTDVRMPGSSELEFLQNLSQVAPTVTVIVATGYPSVATASKALKLPVVAYLAKPMDIEEFLAEINRAVGLSRIRRSIVRAHERIRATELELASVNRCLTSGLHEAFSTSTLNSVTTLLFANVRSELSELEELMSASLQAGVLARPEGEAFHPLALVNLLQETVILLERSKRDFKSKELRDLRKRIETLLRLTTSADPA